MNQTYIYVYPLPFGLNLPFRSPTGDFYRKSYWMEWFTFCPLSHTTLARNSNKLEPHRQLGVRFFLPLLLSSFVSSSSSSVSSNLTFMVGSLHVRCCSMILLMNSFFPLSTWRERDGRGKVLGLHFVTGHCWPGDSSFFPYGSGLNAWLVWSGLNSHLPVCTEIYSYLRRKIWRKHWSWRLLGLPAVSEECCYFHFPE